MSKVKKTKIIWALDPYGDVKTQSSAAQLAKQLSKTTEVDVLYIHGSSGFPINADREAIRMGISDAEKKIVKTLEELKFWPDNHPKILAHNSQYTRTDVKTLVSYAKKVKADAVLVSTHARVGFIRQALGSFAETLILDSSVPTMIVNPKAKIESQTGTILFPTDFGDLSWKAFQKVLSFAKAANASIRIFHQYQGDVQDVSEYVAYFRNNKWLDGEKLLDDELQKIRIKLTKWLASAKKQNIKCDYVFKYGFKNVADATLELAKKDPVWMIAMATVTGPIAATFLGSNARWIVRSAPCPVWVLHVAGK